MPFWNIKMSALSLSPQYACNCIHFSLARQRAEKWFSEKCISDPHLTTLSSLSSPELHFHTHLKCLTNFNKLSFLLLLNLVLQLCEKDQHSIIVNDLWLRIQHMAHPQSHPLSIKSLWRQMMSERRKWSKHITSVSGVCVDFYCGATFEVGSYAEVFAYVLWA